MGIQFSVLSPGPLDRLYDEKLVTYGNSDGSPSNIRYNYMRHGSQLSWGWHNPTAEHQFNLAAPVQEWYNRAGCPDLDNTVFEEFLWQDQGPHQTSPTPAIPRHLPNLVVNPPRHSGWQRQPVTRPDNVYRDEAPIDILWRYDTFDVSRPLSDQSPDQQEGPSGHVGSNDLTLADNITANISQEGGAKLIYYLLSATIQPSDRAGGDLPSVSNVCEWHYQDLMHFFEAAQKEWKAACYEEMESLDKHDIFELTDLPKGQQDLFPTPGIQNIGNGCSFWDTYRWCHGGSWF